ncbi:hypothetical protein C4D60_Mb10t10820 [Musa balbisiana]|uniref:Uncharacterized protein n=1 Tax=Musa balbisiana TaxID=52838 RepID=A0A4S8IW99_MUSBA|nr:hypothetical protein C4D60_Mb10t10820 [Musa balbisiana]
MEINQITAIQIPRRIKFSPPKTRKPQPHEEESIATTGKQKPGDQIDEIFQGKKAKKSMTTAAGREEEKAQTTGKNQAQGTGEGGSGKNMKDKRKKRKEVALDEGPES